MRLRSTFASDRGAPQTHVEDVHAWPHGLSRRQFLGTTGAALGGVVVGHSVWRPVLAEAAASDPTPIPQTARGTPFHVQNPVTREPSTITNFMGVIGVALVGGIGMGTNTETGETEPLLYDVNSRFMTGVYIGEGGHKYHATFAYV